jgi:hypothetical protein
MAIVAYLRHGCKTFVRYAIIVVTSRLHHRRLAREKKQNTRKKNKRDSRNRRRRCVRVISRAAKNTPNQWASYASVRGFYFTRTKNNAQESFPTDSGTAVRGSGRFLNSATTF